MEAAFTRVLGIEVEFVEIQRLDQAMLHVSVTCHIVKLRESFQKMEMRVGALVTGHLDLGIWVAVGQAFTAELTQVGGRKVAIGKDFDETTGRLLPDRDVVLLGEDDASALAAKVRKAGWVVTATEEKPMIRRPSTYSRRASSIERSCSDCASRSLSEERACTCWDHA